MDTMPAYAGSRTDTPIMEIGAMGPVDGASASPAVAIVTLIERLHELVDSLLDDLIERVHRDRRTILQRHERVEFLTVDIGELLTRLAGLGEGELHLLKPPGFIFHVAVELALELSVCGHALVVSGTGVHPETRAR